MTNANGAAAQKGTAMHTIYFTKLFTGGTLKGLLVHESISGPDKDRLARSWRIGREVKRPIGGTSPYRIVDASFQKYTR